MIGLRAQFFWSRFLVLAATAALRRKKMHEADLDKLAGMRLQLEVQVNTLESANINANTLDVMRKGANALRDIHNGLCVRLYTVFSWLF
jgi:charged multivesicular body protein 4